MIWILAQEEAAPAKSAFPSIPAQFPHLVDLLGWCQSMGPGTAAILIIMGIVYLLFGFQIFKALVLLNAAVVGAAIGTTVPVQGEALVACAMIGAVAAAALTWPTMKYAVALMGGIFGAVLGASIWHTVGLDPHLVWAGALTGLIGFGLFSFVLFRGSVMLFMSLQGAFMLIFGLLGMIYKYQEIAPKVTAHLKVQPFLLPAAIFIPAVVGWVFQHHNTTSNGGGGGGKK
jgi:hypothetical protein